jgi:hypothetical protein
MLCLYRFLRKKKNSFLPPDGRLSPANTPNVKITPEAVVQGARFRSDRLEPEVELVGSGYPATAQSARRLFRTPRL